MRDHLNSARAKIEAGDFNLTVPEQTALAVWSAKQNYTMIPIKREKTGPGKPRLLPELIEQIMDICKPEDRNEARAQLHRLMDEKVQVTIEKTWNSEDAYKGIA